MDSDDDERGPPSKRRQATVIDSSDEGSETGVSPPRASSQASAVDLDDDDSSQDSQNDASFADTYLAFFFERKLHPGVLQILSTKDTALARVETAWVSEKTPETTSLISRDVFRVAEQHYDLVKSLTFVGAVQGHLKELDPKASVQDCLRADIQKLVRESYHRRVQRGQTPVDSEDVYVNSYSAIDVKDRVALIKELATFKTQRILARGRAACGRLTTTNVYLRNLSDDVLLDERLREYFRQRNVAQCMTNRSDPKYKHYDELLKVWSRVALAHLSVRLLKEVVDAVSDYRMHHATKARSMHFAGITPEQFKECVVDSFFPVPAPSPFSVAQLLNACDLASRYAEGSDVTPPYQSF